MCNPEPEENTQKLEFMRQQELIVLPNLNSPFDYFDLFGDNKCYELIVRETNACLCYDGFSERWKSRTF